MKNITHSPPSKTNTTQKSDDDKESESSDVPDDDSTSIEFDDDSAASEDTDSKDTVDTEDDVDATKEDDREETAANTIEPVQRFFFESHFQRKITEEQIKHALTHAVRHGFDIQQLQSFHLLQTNQFPTLVED